MPGPLLMQLGSVAFELVPLNTNDYSHSHGAAFAEKPVLGIMPPLEHVGENVESWTIKGKLYPHKFGGLGHLDELRAMSASGDPQYFVRGDGAVFGWVVVTDVKVRSTYLDGQDMPGVGKAITVDITVKQAGAPGNGSFFGALATVFLWAL